MNIDDFITLYESREKCLRALFTEKHAQYGTDEDVFQNNTVAAIVAELSPESHLLIQTTKHFGVLMRLAGALVGDIDEKEMAQWRESMDDISLWMQILNGLLEERFQRGVADNADGP